MADPMFTGDIFIDGCLPPIKSEPMAMDSGGAMISGNASSASMPIPAGRIRDLTAELNFDLASASPGGIFPDPSANLYHGQSVWSPRPDIKMEDDDIFQVDKADLFQGPTLAELNANDDTLLEDLNFDDLVLPEEGTYMIPNVAVPRAPPATPTGPLTIATSFPPDSGSFLRDFPSRVPPLGTSLKVTPSSTFGVFEVDEKPVLIGVPSAGPDSGSSGASSNLAVLEDLDPTVVLTPRLSPRSPALSPGAVPSPPSPHRPQNFCDRFLKSTIQGNMNASCLPPTRSNSVGSKSRPTGLSRLSSNTSPLVGFQGNMNASCLPPTRSNSVGSKSRPTGLSRLSSSAPTHLGLEQIWARREPRPHLLSTSSLAEATSTSSISTGGILSPEAHDFSLDEGFDSEDDTDHEEEDSSDAGSDSDGEGGASSSRSKKERYFWQYNVQAKGPKGQRLVHRNKTEDPHYLDEVTDPVFSPICSLQGIKHSGKARKGDGNDLTPNPRKLAAIGRELDKLNRAINEMTPVNELPFDVRSKSRKEKNKLASRACRLKKKAQHEANKIKLYGLENEHRRLMNGIQQLKTYLVTRVTGNPPEQLDPGKVDKICKHSTKVKIAGQTTEFVNRVLDRQKSGVPNGGLDELHHHPT